MSGGFANFTFIASSWHSLQIKHRETKRPFDHRRNRWIPYGYGDLFSAIDSLPYPGIEPTALWFTVFEPKTNTFNHINLQLLHRVVGNAAPPSILDDATMKFYGQLTRGNSHKVNLSGSHRALRQEFTGRTVTLNSPPSTTPGPARCAAISRGLC